MSYVNTTTLQIVEAKNIMVEYPDVNFPNRGWTDEDLEPFGYANLYYPTNPPVPGMYENLVEIQPEEIDGVWYRQFIVEPMTPEEIDQVNAESKQANKTQAETLLQQTDWTATVDINNPAYSNPYLANQDAFLAYRSQVRQIAVNPPITVDVWPIKPQEEWSSV